MTAQFPSGLTLAEAKRLLVGVRVVVGIGIARAGRPTVEPWEYEILNVTRQSLIVGIVRRGGEVNRERTQSILHATGASRSKYPNDVVHYLHPVNVRALQQLLGVKMLERRGG